MHYLEVLSDYICSTKLEDLPDDVVVRARWLIADCLPLTCAGMGAPEMKALAESQLAPQPKGNASVFGLHQRTAANVASLLNGTAGTFLEMVEENIYAKGLPAIQIVPTVLAVAEERRATGREALAALVMGYEVSCRISRGTKTKVEIHPSGTFGTIGAAVAAGKLFGFDATAMRELLNVSATLGLATSRKAIIEGATVGRAYSGASGYMGLLAADLVRAGFTGESDGVRSVYGSVYGDREEVVSRIPQTSRIPFDPDIVIDKLGREFVITKGFIKMYPCARSIHPALDLIEELMARSAPGRIDPRDVERIDFRAYVSPTTLATKEPISAFAARFSLNFAVATLLYHGRGQLSNFSEEAYGNPVIRDLARKVEIVENLEYTKFFPDKQPCDVKMTLKNGSVLEAHADYTKGDPKNPRRPEEFRAKFFEVSKLVWDEQTAHRMLDGLMAFEQVPDVRAFFADYDI